MVEQMGVARADLMSNQKFANVLMTLGVDPPMKISPATNEKTFAFAKADEDFVALLDHPDIMVRTVVEARLETKSTIEETRTKRFLAIADLEFPNLGSCCMPMPVIIGAAHTHRVGGGWDLNVQNLGRQSTLRDAICSAEGHTLLVVDSSQIEARITAWFCGQHDLVEQFRSGQDVYSIFASDVFEHPVTKANKPERFVGKTGILQLGYACGWPKFQRTVKMLSRNTDTPIELSDEQAIAVVDKYRAKYRQITYKWRALDQILMQMHLLPDVFEYKLDQRAQPISMPPVTFFKNCMVGPTELLIHFPDLQYDEAEGSWYFRDGKHMRRTYGASMLETIAQHVARCIVMMAAVRLKEPMANLGSRLVHTAHDELVYHVPNSNIEQAKIWAQLEMTRTPTWAPGLPLACEIGTGMRYGDAK
jgi:DNA polymerase